MKRLLTTIVALALSTSVAAAGGLGLSPNAPSSTLRALQRLSIAAVQNNPRANPVMTSPPAITAAPGWTANTAFASGAKVVNVSGTGATSSGNWYTETATTCTTASSVGPTGTGTGISDGTCVWNYVASHPTARFWNNSAVNSYLWNQGTGAAGVGGAVKFIGGIPVTGSSECEASKTATVAGVQAQGGGRWEFVSDATYVVVRVFNGAPNSAYRVIVNGQYASLSATNLAPGAWGYLLIDFSAAGGRALRDITIENELNTQFCGVDVGITEGVYLPNKSNSLNVVWTGDSFVAAAGADMQYDGFAYVICDYLGAANCIDTGIGGTGYLRDSTSGTALSRINDVINAARAYPNAVVIDENIYNDVNYFTAAQIQAAALAYMQALRAALPTTPIFELGVNAAMNGGAGWAAGVAAENAKKAAVAAMNDPLIFFVPSIGAPGGSMMTGTGNDQSPNGTGNSDLRTNGTTIPHSNTFGHAIMAQLWLAGMRSDLEAAGY